ncbi:MAG: hotdog fold thioesterase [Prevotella sp.]|jgi:acyl-CoA thioesterase|nr:hotdog fold thioesterase [Prevotella sp.]
MTLKDLLNRNDRFAAANGIQLTEIREGYARAEMTVSRNHLNGGNVCQGGALFTLADLAFAAVTNSHGQLSFGIQSSITFSRSAMEGDVLRAEATETINHHKIPYCEVKISNQRGELIAVFTGMAYRKSDRKMEVEGLM